MSKVTLESLRADFDAAVERAVNAIYEDNKVGHRPDIKRYNHLTSPDRFLVFADYDWEYLDCGDLVLAARPFAELYVMARDYGLEAAMLYKLSDGAIDPRKSS